MYKNITITFFYALILLFNTNTYAFMSGVDPSRDGGKQLEFIDGVILTGPPSVKVNAGYGIFKNNTDEEINLIRLTSPVFDEIQLHDMQYDSNGTAKMIRINEFIIPANGQINLEKGGKHFMLIERRRELKSGQIIKMVVEDKNERRYMLHLKVNNPMDHDNNGHQDHHMH